MMVTTASLRGERDTRCFLRACLIVLDKIFRNGFLHYALQKAPLLHFLRWVDPLFAKCSCLTLKTDVLVLIEP